jgi:flavorubredoxin
MTADISSVADGIYRLSANVYDILFEGLWPIPNGVAMNSYIVKGEKTAIVDGVCGWDGVPETLFSQLDRMGIALTDIDYVVINHMEPDHSGWLKDFRKIRGDAFSIVTSQKAVPLLEAFYGIPSMNVRTVKDGDTLDLGAGHVLHFAEIPNVHWPETIATFDAKTGTLMSCDAFGSFGAVGSSPYDDGLPEKDIAFFENEVFRYYANIVATFSGATGRAIAKVESLIGDKLKIIAPGHGLVWRKNPQRILDLYKRCVKYHGGVAEPIVTVIWGSMYGNTEAAVPVAVEALKEAGLEVREFRVPQAPLGDILASAWVSTGIVLAMPTYEYKMFPPMAEIVSELGRKHVKSRQAFRFGSFGWSGGAQKELDEITERYKMLWNFTDPVEFKGSPKEADLAAVRAGALRLAENVREALKTASAA